MGLFCRSWARSERTSGWGAGAQVQVQRSERGQEDALCVRVDRAVGRTGLGVAVCLGCWGGNGKGLRCLQWDDLP